MRIILLTGQPGVGKTTMAERVYHHFRDVGVKVEGVITHEARKGERRTGFKTTDLSSGQDGWLAKKDSGRGPRIGPYRVITDDLERIASAALKRATRMESGLAIVDEIGPIEMTSGLFRRTVSTLFDQDRPTLATFKIGSHYPEIERLRGRSMVVEMTRDNRGQVYAALVQFLEDSLGISKSE